MRSVSFRVVMALLETSIGLAQRQSIEQAECFIGTDPGEGRGTALTIPTGNAIVTAEEWRQSGLPSVGFGDVVYVRVKSSGFIDRNGKNGKTVKGAWSFPMSIVFPTRSVLRGAEAKIIRPGVEYPLLKSATAADGTFDQVFERVLVQIPIDSLEVGDTLYVRLQGHDDLWSDWAQIPIRREYLMLSAPYNLTAAYSTTSGPHVSLSWRDSNGGAVGYSVDRKLAGEGYAVIGQTAAATTTFEDNATLDPARTYYWRVQVLGASPDMPLVHHGLHP